MPKLRNIAKLENGRRTLIIPDLNPGELNYCRLNYFAAVDHYEFEALLDNWFQTKRKEFYND